MVNVEETKKEGTEVRTKGYEYQVLGLMIIALGIIGGIVLGNTYKIVTPSKYGSWTTEEFNYYLMLASTMSSIILGALFLALGDIVKQLTLTKEILLKNKNEN